jgi:hypothetical protein
MATVFIGFPSGLWELITGDFVTGAAAGTWREG